MREPFSPALGAGIFAGAITENVISAIVVTVFVIALIKLLEVRAIEADNRYTGRGR